MNSQTKLLITGGNGFLGQNLARGLQSFFSEIILCSHSIKEEFVKNNFRYVKLNVSSAEEVQNVFRKFTPDYVIHAAAIKTVTEAELHLQKCIQTNIIGSENVAKAAIANGVKVVVGISSIRAAEPVVGMYAMSKSIMERLFCHFSFNSSTHFICLRLGNLVWAPGSVFQTWRQMLKETGEIQTTGYEMRRFFIKAEDAISLVKILIDHSSKFSGYTVVPEMKIAKVGEVLEKFISKYGGAFRKASSSITEKKHDVLVGYEEEKFARALQVEGQKFYLISKLPTDALTQSISFETKEMSSNEIEMIINNKFEKSNT